MKCKFLMIVTTSIAIFQFPFESQNGNSVSSFNRVSPIAHNRIYFSNSIDTQIPKNVAAKQIQTRTQTPRIDIVSVNHSII